MNLLGRCFKLVIVDDDEETRGQLLELAKLDLPNWTVKAFENIAEACEQNSIDILLIDISAVAYGNMWEHAYGPIASFMERHPGTSVVVTSGVSRNAADEVIEKVKEVAGREPIYGGSGVNWKDTLAAIGKSL